MTTKRRVEIYTDGACSGNPGPGGWGVLMRWNGHQKTLIGGALIPPITAWNSPQRSRL
nr:RNase H family protein [Iodidimonas nitroreducens]